MAFALRPHVELISVLDMSATPVVLPGASAAVRQITLSASPDNKAVSAVIDIPPAWQRERGTNPDTFVECYLLSGDLNVGGDLQLLPHHYFRTEIGAAAGPFTSVHGARVLVFTEGDLMAWEPISVAAPTIGEGIVHHDTNQMPWIDTFVPGPNVTSTGAQLKLKLMYMDPRSKAYTFLILAEAGWNDHRFAHHPVVEEAYTIRGHMTYNFGTLEVDTYFYRPPGIKHGHFDAFPDGTVWLIRSDGELENIYTSLEGEPGNWAYGTPREPVMTDHEHLVRSKRTGPWSGYGQHIPHPHDH